MQPVPGNLDAAADPDLLVLLHMVQKALQRHDAPGASCQAAMQADAQHLGRIQSVGIAFGIKRIEAVPQVGVKVICLRKALRQ